MEMTTNNSPKIEFTRGNSKVPLPGVRSNDINTGKDRTKDGTSDKANDVKNVVK